jgi:hypothetical protein
MSPNIQTAFFFEGFHRANHGFKVQSGEVGDVLPGKADFEN